MESHVENAIIRKNTRILRKNLSPEMKQKASNEISEKMMHLICSLPEIHQILCFYPTEEEVNLLTLYEKLLGAGKRLYFPVTDMKQHEIIFYEVENLREFQSGAMNIMEPISRENAYVGLDSETLSITPGLAFDASGNRIGYGGGFYDRFFSMHPEVRKVAVCFQVQKVEQIIPESWDIPMDDVISEDI